MSSIAESFAATIDYLYALTSHLSPLTSHLSPLTSHLSPLTSHLSPLTSHLSPLFNLLSPPLFNIFASLFYVSMLPNRGDSTMPNVYCRYYDVSSPLSSTPLKPLLVYLPPLRNVVLDDSGDLSLTPPGNHPPPLSPSRCTYSF